MPPRKPKPSLIVRLSTPTFGADPEFFIRQAGKLIPSDQVIPKEGYEPGGLTISSTKIVRDGIQAEINFGTKVCRQRACASVAGLLNAFGRFVAARKLNIDFSPVVHVTEEEFFGIPKAERVLGCAPSLNAYDPHAKVGVDGELYTVRSAGGHLHFGCLKRPGPDYIQVFDVIIGNTCVLLDRDPMNAERREVYGRAGEYRVPGEMRVEYRTLSNFWLRAPELMSFVLGLGRLAVSVVENDHAKTLLKLVDIQKVVHAINTNDFDLAMETFEVVEAWVGGLVFDAGHFRASGIGWSAKHNELFKGDVNSTPLAPPEKVLEAAREDFVPLSPELKPKFRALVSLGIDKVFPIESTLQRWKQIENHFVPVGWETFLSDRFNPEEFTS